MYKFVIEIRRKAFYVNEIINRGGYWMSFNCFAARFGNSGAIVRARGY